MRGKILALIYCLLLALAPVQAQDAVSYLLSRVNNLRATQGLPAYTLHPALSAAANSHARWMATTGTVSHYQANGSGPRARAQNAGFPTNWVSENIYMGPDAGPGDAWNFWLNSPPHYAGLVSRNYDKIGIGSASGAGTAFVLVFGNSSGRLPQASGSGGSAAQPSYVLGIDEVGNIQHEVQTGHTISDIAFFYGYSWDDIPHIMEINEMTEEDILLLQPGDVVLVPPKAGTFTPTAETAEATNSPTATISAAASPRSTATAAPPRATVSPGATRQPRPAVTIAIAVLPSPTRAAPAISGDNGPGTALGQLALLGAAIVLQLGIIGGATYELLRRSL